MVINVLHAIGDIIFCEPIYRHYWIQEEQKPVVIIRDHLMWLQDYIESAIFLPTSKWDGDIDNAVPTESYMPLRFANQIYRGYEKHDHHDYENMMLDKYRLVGLDPELWKTIKLDFDNFKGKRLMNSLGIMKDTEYSLYNTMSQAGQISLSVKENEVNFQIHTKDDYSIIDWSGTMLCAKENHHVSTCTFFILQALKNIYPDWNSPCYIYPRPNDDGLRGISQFKPDFNLILCQ